MAENILFICGSLNQTTIMHKIASRLEDFNCYFSPFYDDGIIGLAATAGAADFTILGGKHRYAAETYLKKEGLRIDYGGKENSYSLVVTCTDLIIQKNIRGKKIILVQEGMTEFENFLFYLVKYLKLPRFLANTAATGLSDAYQVFCVASHGYRELFIRKGVNPDKIVVTGIPNYDNVYEYLENDFPYRGYVLVATSSIRETLGADNRDQFLMGVKRIAGDRQVIFKLHPNENHARATSEIRRYFPNEIILAGGNVHHMIANCSALAAQNSSVIYTGLLLEKEVHSYLNQKFLEKLLPLQNGGKSMDNIAGICRQVIHSPNVMLKRTISRNQRQQRETKIFGTVWEIINATLNSKPT